MIELIGLISVVVVAVGAYSVFLLDHQAKRHQDAIWSLQKQNVEATVRMAEKHAAERQELMDRIQAPEVVLHRLNANGVEPQLAPVGDGPWISDPGDN